MIRSVRARLTAASVGLASVCLILGGVGLEQAVRRQLLAQVDATLASEARLLASTVEEEHGQLEVEFGEFDMRDFAAQSPRAYIQVWKGEATAWRSPSLGSASLTPFGGTLEAPVSMWQTAPSGAQVRALGVRFTPRLDEEDAARGVTARPAPVVLVLARDVTPTTQALTTLRRALLGVGGLTLLVLTLALWLGVRRALRPVEVAAAEIAQIGGGELSRRIASDGLPTELLPVVERTNELLSRLEQAFQRERAFSQEVAHELRTPIAGLRAVVEVALRRERDPEHYRGVLDDGLAILIGLQTMVEDLLKLARLESGRQELASAPLDLNETLLEAWTPLAPRAEARRLQVTWELAEEARAELDPGLVQVVARNLLENAVSYADAGGRITVTTRADADGVQLSVANTGSALTNEQAQQATQRFWRGDAARTVGEHCGLGLALVERSLRALGGDLALRSEVGGTFQAEVTLPAAS